MKTIIGVVCLFGLAISSPISQDESVQRFMVGNFVDCANNDFGLCLKEYALKATERLGAARKYKIFDGVTILNGSPKQARSLDVLPSEPEERNKMVTERLWDTASDLLQKSELELSFAGDEEEEETESRALNEVEEGRGKKKKELKKKLKILVPLILLAKAKAVALVVLSIVVIAASLAKLALVAKIAFLIKAFSLIKELIAKKSSGGGGDEHGWAPPHGGHVEESHGHGWESNGWSRSKNDANSLAYSAYKK